jgi:hypothetical protein
VSQFDQKNDDDDERGVGWRGYALDSQLDHLAAELTSKL